MDAQPEIRAPTVYSTSEVTGSGQSISTELMANMYAVNRAAVFHQVN
jgi:hypothetical protein